MTLSAPLETKTAYSTITMYQTTERDGSESWLLYKITRMEILNSEGDVETIILKHDPPGAPTRPYHAKTLSEAWVIHNRLFEDAIQAEMTRKGSVARPQSWETITIAPGITVRKRR